MPGDAHSIFEKRLRASRTELVSICLGGLLLLGLPFPSSFAQEKAANIFHPSQNYWGTTVTVDAVEKTKNYIDILGRELTAKPGYSIIIVKLKFRMPADTLKFENCRLNDKFESTLKQLTVRSPSGSQGTLNIYFEVPEETAIMTFHLENLVFDVQNFGVK
jgi:hypothetical protein